MQQAFQAYGRPIETVISFNYLGRVMKTLYNYWMEVVGNLQKARKGCPWLTRILGREGASLGVSGILCKTVLQAVLIFGSKTWLVTPRMGRSLGGFQHRVSRWITGRQTKQQSDGSWEYPPLEIDMQEAGLEDMGEYFPKRKNAVAQYILMRPILDLCK